MNDEPNIILLVEDNPHDAELLEHALRENGIENKVVLARDGVEALVYVRNEPPPRLVLLDLKMPRVDGIELLRELKADAQTCSIPIVIFTSSSQERDVLDAYRFGVNGYVVKPVDVDAFFRLVGDLGRYWLTANRVPPP
jgi:two-component system response regulator